MRPALIEVSYPGIKASVRFDTKLKSISLDWTRKGPKQTSS